MMKQINKIILVLCAVMQVANAPAQTVRSVSAVFRLCRPTSAAETITILPEQLPYTVNGVTFTEAGTKQAVLKNVLGCDSVLTMTVNTSHPGGLRPFSVGANSQVYFSPGNLQYLASEDGSGTDLTHEVAAGSSESNKGIYRFAQNQWDMIGATEDNLNPSGKQTTWIDELSNELALRMSEHAISGDDHPYAWRLLSAAEWNYLLYGRDNASKLYFYARVNEIAGLVIMPDGWTPPADQKIMFGIKEYDVNDLASHSSGRDWTILEQAGAVFLPAQSLRVTYPLGPEITTGERGCYLLSSGLRIEQYDPQRQWCQCMLGYLHFSILVCLPLDNVGQYASTCVANPHDVISSASNVRLVRNRK